MISGYANGMIAVLYKDIKYKTGSFSLAHPIVSAIHLKDQQYIFGLDKNFCFISFLISSDKPENEMAQFKRKFVSKILCKVDDEHFASMCVNNIIIFNVK
jgi:hypothetical protein